MNFSETMQAKQIHLKYSPASLLLEALGALALLAVLALACIRYPTLGSTVPRTFGPDGTPLEWAVKESALIYPIFAVFIYVVVTAGVLVVRRAAPPDRPCPVLVAVLNGFSAAKIFFLLYALRRTHCAMSGIPAGAWALPLLIGLFVITAAITVCSIRKRHRRNTD